MKSRFRNWITTVIGIILMLTAVCMYIMSKFLEWFDISLLESISVLILGWVFLTARDTLLEGLFLNLFKIKKDELPE